VSAISDDKQDLKEEIIGIITVFNQDYSRTSISKSSKIILASLLTKKLSPLLTRTWLKDSEKTLDLTSFLMRVLH
jgi:hypothetical protein